jgi:hypothetical protein
LFFVVTVARSCRGEGHSRRPERQEAADKGVNNADYWELSGKSQQKEEELGKLQLVTYGVQNGGVGVGEEIICIVRGKLSNQGGRGKKSEEYKCTHRYNIHPSRNTKGGATTNYI